MDKNIILEILKRPGVLYRPEFAKLSKGVQGGVFLSQLFYWMGKEKDLEGWLYKNQKEWELETGLTRRNQETARKNLKAAGLMEEKLTGNPAKLYYRINLDRVYELISRLYEPAKLDCTNQPNKIERTSQASINGSAILSLTKNTTKNTTKKARKVDQFIVEYFNKVAGKKLKLNPDRKRYIKSTLENYGLKEILYGIHNLVVDQWSIKNNQVRLDRLISPGRRAANLEALGTFPFRKPRKSSNIASQSKLEQELIKARERELELKNNKFRELVE